MSTIGYAPRIEVYYDKASNNIISWGPFTVSGAEITSSATATISISSPTGTELVAATAMTAALPNFTFDLDTSTVATYILDEGYKAEILVTYSGSVYQYNILFDVVRQPFPCMVGDTDLEAYFPGAADRRGSLTDYSAQILVAFEEVKAKIIAKGFRPALLFDPAAFRPSIIFRTLAICHEGVWKKEGGDRWQESRDYYQELYMEAIGMALESVSVRYDDDEDGKLGYGEKVTTSPIRLLL